jgi:hypothetical protein
VKRSSKEFRYEITRESEAARAKKRAGGYRKPSGSFYKDEAELPVEFQSELYFPRATIASDHAKPGAGSRAKPRTLSDKGEAATS